MESVFNLAAQPQESLFYREAMASIAPAGEVTARQAPRSGYQADLEGANASSGADCCSIILTIFSGFLVLLFFPLSLLFTVKVRSDPLSINYFDVMPCCMQRFNNAPVYPSWDLACWRFQNRKRYDLKSCAFTVSFGL